jgi:hypothetical protein
MTLTSGYPAVPTLCLFLLLTLAAACAENDGEDERGTPAVGSEQPAAGSEQPATSRAAIVTFTQVAEPRESAFRIRIPRGWQTEGGIFRVDPTGAGGPAQSVAAKLDFAVKKDEAGSVMIRWLPDVMFYDSRRSPAGQMGLFPPGSNYQGMTVRYVMPAEQFIREVAFPYAHPQAGNVTVTEQKPLPGLARRHREQAQSTFPGATFSYDAALVTFTYAEDGRNYEEKMVAVVEDWGQLGAGMWGNKETMLARTPVKEFEEWEPYFSTIQGSVVLNPSWVVGEIQGQIRRGEIVLNTQREIQRIGREIVDHRQRTNGEIMNDMYLTFTEQEEYVNPYTNEVEMGTNQWRHRWVNESGDVIYTDSEDYNPNVDIEVNRSDYRRTPIRRRGGG